MEQIEALSTEELLEIARQQAVPLSGGSETVSLLCWKCILQRQPNTVELLVEFAEFILNSYDLKNDEDDENGIRAKALICLKRAVELQPNEGADKYFYLGQETEGFESYEYLTKGYNITLSNDDLKKSETQIRLADFAALLAELYMTDLCDEEDAELSCRTWAEKAITHSPEHIGGLLANLKLNKVLGELEKAKEALNRAVEIIMKIWKKKYDEEEAFEEDHNFPEYPIRMDMAALCLDLAEFEKADLILDTLFEENDSDARVFYLKALSAMHQSKFDLALDFVSEAKELEKEELRSPSPSPSEDLEEEINKRKLANERREHKVVNLDSAGDFSSDRLPSSPT